MPVLAATLIAGACSGGSGPAATAGAGESRPPTTTRLEPSAATAALPHDPDDPAVWRHPTDPARSLVLGTDKAEGVGGLFVFRLDGTLAQAITPLDRPNNVDVEYGVDVGGGRGAMDIAVVTERKQHRLRVFGIPRDGGPLVDLAPAGLAVLADQPGDAGEPMGIALYKRAGDGAVFAIVAPKTGPADGYLWQYRLVGGPAGLVAEFVRRFGTFDRTPRQGELGEIEAVTVDDARGYVYYSDEWAAIRKYHADPAHPEAAHELATFGRDGYVGDREGLAIMAGGDGGGYLVSSDQMAGGTRLKVYRRDGTAANPHDHAEVLTVLTASDETDGLDVTGPLPGYPGGLLVMMNSTARNFLLYDWRRIEAAIRGQ